MNVNRTGFLAKKAMIGAGTTKNRPEQMLAKALIKSHISEDVESEYTPKDLKALEDLDLTGNRSPRLDIAIPSKRVAIRLNGESHDTLNQQRYDLLQKIFLESQVPPWVVVDFIKDKMSILWSCRNHGLTELELKGAYAEIRIALVQVITLPRNPNPLVIRKLANSQLFRSSKL